MKMVDDLKLTPEQEKRRAELKLELKKKLQERSLKWELSFWQDFQRKFNSWFVESLQDPLELCISYPSDLCEQQFCLGWREYYGDESLLEELYDIVEEYLMDEYDNEDRVERKMEKMTDKKVIRLFGEEHLDAEFPPCPHKEYCDCI